MWISLKCGQDGAAPAKREKGNNGNADFQDSGFEKISGFRTAESS
jgi:hypothetical protein